MPFWASDYGRKRDWAAMMPFPSSIDDVPSPSFVPLALSLLKWRPNSRHVRRLRLLSYSGTFAPIRCPLSLFHSQSVAAGLPAFPSFISILSVIRWPCKVLLFTIWPWQVLTLCLYRRRMPPEKTGFRKRAPWRFFFVSKTKNPGHAKECRVPPVFSLYAIGNVFWHFKSVKYVCT